MIGRGLIDGLVFTAHRIELLPYPRTNMVWGRWATAPASSDLTSVHLAQWAVALKDEEMDHYLAQHWRVAHNLGVGSTYIPARKNRRGGPAVYKITALLGTNMAYVNGSLYITAAQFNDWRRRTATRAKSG